MPSVPPDSPQGARARRQLWTGVIMLAALIGTVTLLVQGGTIALESVTGAFNWIYFLLVVAFFVWLFSVGEWTREERKRLIVIVVLFAGAAIFWSAFEQAASTLNLFAKEKTRNSVLGIGFPSSWFQAVNAVMIILLAPVFAWLWVRLGERDPSSPTKFGFGLLFVGLGFAVMIGAARAAMNGDLVSPGWLIATYLLHTIGELCLSPVGLSSMTKLAPDRVKGMMMGVWFLAASMGNLIAGLVVGTLEKFSHAQVFGAVTAFAVVASLVMFVLVRPIRRMLERE
jgi:POT family proton-dependent oligopeptide transporter